VIYSQKKIYSEKNELTEAYCGNCNFPVECQMIVSVHLTLNPQDFFCENSKKTT
jgi:hypothetical protein